ncbi:MAG: YdcF family protein [Parasporobacterium sp.]|nr:YdcF family protein [Parasporobacterium sp.]
MNGFTIFRILILIAGGLLFLWFFLPAVFLHNFNIGALTGMGLSLLMILYGILGIKINALIRSGWEHTAGRILGILLIVVCAGILALAGACTAAMIKGLQGSPEPGSTVIVLGARVYGNRVSRAMKGRLDEAVRYLNEYPESVCIVSGGQGKNETATEASVMYQYLIGQGIDPERIRQEDQSTDTQENLRYSRQIIEEEGLNPHVALATNGYHAYRAENYAREAGLEDAETLPAATAWYLLPTSLIREMYGILEQWFLKS